jgi:hypothetical protein
MLPWARLAFCFGGGWPGSAATNLGDLKGMNYELR